MDKVKIGKKRVKYFENFPEALQRPCGQFTEKVKEIRNSMKKVETLKESKAILFYIPIVSRAGTDIEAALQKLKDLEDKYVALVVLHHTFDKESVVPDSSRAVNRDKDRTITVDCLFHEDEGLLKCQKNDDAVKIVAKWLRKVKYEAEPEKAEDKERGKKKTSKKDKKKGIKKGNGDGDGEKDNGGNPVSEE